METKKPKIQKKSDELKARLIKLGCFDEFCENLKEQKRKNFEEFAGANFKRYYLFSDLILRSFNWLNTPQGYIFWDNIYKKINII